MRIRSGASEEDMRRRIGRDAEKMRKILGGDMWGKKDKMRRR